MKLLVTPEVLEVLEDAGWREGRSEDVARIKDSLVASGFELDRFMLEVLSSFVGLSIPLPAEVTRSEYFLNEDPFIVDPIGIGVRNIGEARELRERFGVNFCPLGWWLCRSHIYFSSEGLVVAVLPGILWRLGNDFNDAMNFIILANSPLDAIENQGSLGQVIRSWSISGPDGDCRYRDEGGGLPVGSELEEEVVPGVRVEVNASRGSLARESSSSALLGSGIPGLAAGDGFRESAGVGGEAEQVDGFLSGVVVGGRH